MATIQGVYIALFGRPADPTGLAYFNGVTKNGADLSGIGNLSGQKEYTDRFSGQSNLQIINSIYQSLFGRSAESAGLEFFTNALTKGTLTINNIAIAILDGAQGDDKTIVTNKLTAADLFTSHVDTGSEIASYSGTKAADSGRAYLAPITKDVATIPTAAATDTTIATLVTNQTLGNTVALAITDDNIAVGAVGTAGVSSNSDDTFTATNSVAGIASAAGIALATADVIAGGLGNDILKFTVTTASTGAGLAPTISGVETIQITSTGAGVVGTLDLTNATGVTTVLNSGSTGGVVFQNIDVTAAAGLKISGAAVATDFGFKVAQVGGTSDSATLTLDKAVATGATTVSGIETLTINSTGTSGLSSLVDANAATIKITGSGDFTLTNAGTLTGLKTVDASAFNGNVTFNASSSTAGVTYTGAKGIDNVTLGAGTDKIVFNAANISTANKIDNITGFATGTDKIDVHAFSFTGDKVTIQTYNAAPSQGDTFGGHAVAVDTTNGVAYFDTNNNGVIDISSDLAVHVTGSNPVIGDIVFA